MRMFRPQSRRTLERPIGDRVTVKRPLVKLAEVLRLVRVVVRGQGRTTDLPLFRIKDDRPGSAMQVYRPSSEAAIRRWCTQVHVDE
jgi:hypothetical protein